MSSGSGGGDLGVVGPGFVFIVDVCTAAEELRALKRELLLVVEQLPETALVGLVTFDSMVRVHDLGFTECSRVVLFPGERELLPEQVSFLHHGCTKLPNLSLFGNGCSCGNIHPNAILNSTIAMEPCSTNMNNRMK